MERQYKERSQIEKARDLRKNSALNGVSIGCPKTLKTTKVADNTSVATRLPNELIAISIVRFGISYH